MSLSSGFLIFRIFEDVKEELMNLYQEREALEIKSESESYDKVKSHFSPTPPHPTPTPTTQ